MLFLAEIITPATLQFTLGFLALVSGGLPARDYYEDGHIHEAIFEDTYAEGDLFKTSRCCLFQTYFFFATDIKHGSGVTKWHDVRQVAES